MELFQIVSLYLVVGAGIALFWRFNDQLNTTYNYSHSIMQDILIILFFPIMILADIFTNKNR